MTNTPSPDEDRELIALRDDLLYLADHAGFLTFKKKDGSGIDLALVATLCLDRLDRLESLLSDRAKLEHLLCEARLVIRKCGGGDAVLNEIDDALNRSTDHTP